MSKLLRGTFFIHAVVTVVLGAACLVAPGRVLGWLGFPGLDGFGNFFARLLGAAMLALAWTSIRGWLATSWKQAKALVEGEVVFTLLGCVGLLRLGLKPGVHWPWLLWATLGLLGAFGLLWILFLVRGRKAPG